MMSEQRPTLSDLLWTRTLKMVTPPEAGHKQENHETRIQEIQEMFKNVKNADDIFKTTKQILKRNIEAQGENFGSIIQKVED